MIFILFFVSLSCLAFVKRFLDCNRRILKLKHLEAYAQLDLLSVALKELLEDPASLASLLTDLRFQEAERFLRAYFKFKTSCDLELFLPSKAPESVANGSFASSTATNPSSAILVSEKSAVNICDLVPAGENDIFVKAQEKREPLIATSAHIEASSQITTVYGELFRLSLTNCSKADLDIIFKAKFLLNLVCYKLVVHRFFPSKPFGRVLVFSSKEHALDMKAKIERACKYAIVELYEELQGEESETLDLYGIPPCFDPIEIIEIFSAHERKQIVHIGIPMFNKAIAFKGELIVAFKDKQSAKAVRERLNNLLIRTSALTATFVPTLPSSKDILIAFKLGASPIITKTSSVKKFCLENDHGKLYFILLQSPEDAENAMKKPIPGTYLFYSSGLNLLTDYRDICLPLYTRLMSAECASTMRDQLVLRNESELRILNLHDFSWDLDRFEEAVMRLIGPSLRGFRFMVDISTGLLRSEVNLIISDTKIANDILVKKYIILNRKPHQVLQNRREKRSFDDSSTLSIRGFNRNALGSDIYDLLSSYGPLNKLSFVLNEQATFFGEIIVTYAHKMLGAVVEKALDNMSIGNGIALFVRMIGVQSYMDTLAVLEWKPNMDVTRLDVKESNKFYLPAQEVLFLTFSSPDDCQRADQILKKANLKTIESVQRLIWSAETSENRRDHTYKNSQRGRYQRD